MKKIYSLLALFFIALLFLACSGSVSQESYGSVSIDSEKLVHYVIQRSPIFANKTSAGPTFKLNEYVTSTNSLSCELIVRLSTLGDYSTTQEITYTQEIPFDENNSNNTSVEEMFRTNMNKNITITDIPIGSNISVKADVSMRISSVSGSTLNDYQIATGMSPLFTIMEGSNLVTIRLIILDDDTGDDDTGNNDTGNNDTGDNDEEDTVIPVNIILYNNVPGRTDNALYSFDMKIEGNSLTADNRQELTALDEYTLLDYVSDAAGTLYYLVRDTSSDDYVKIIKPDNTSNSEKVASPSWNMYDTKLAIDAESGNFF